MSSGATGVFNVGSASRITINHLAKLMEKVSGVSVGIEYGPERPGDVRDSLADVSKAREAFGFNPSSDIEAGLREYMSWIKTDPITIKRLEL